MNDQSSQSKTSPEIRASHPQSHLWFPSPPAHDGLQLTPLYPSMEPLPFQPLLSIDFGGPNGLYLSELTGIVCYLGYDPHPLLGMQAVYADGRSVLFGSRRGCEVYFAISGPDGERITGVGVLKHVNDLMQTVYRRTVTKGVCGLKVGGYPLVQLCGYATNRITAVYHKLRSNSTLCYNSVSVEK